MQSTKSLPNGDANIAEFNRKTSVSRKKLDLIQNTIAQSLWTSDSPLQICSAPETGTLGSVSTAAGGNDNLGISAGAGAAIGITGVGAITCVANADAAIADADPSSDSGAALSWSGMLKGLICCIFLPYSSSFDDLNTT